MRFPGVEVNLRRGGFFLSPRRLYNPICVANPGFLSFLFILHRALSVSVFVLMGHHGVFEGAFWRCFFVPSYVLLEIEGVTVALCETSAVDALGTVT